MRVIDLDAGPWFDEARFDSNAFSVAAVGAASAVRMHVLRLGPGGVIGEHPAIEQQLLVVLSGRGSVSTPTDGPHEIGIGQAAVFEPGETHTTRSDEGLVALAIEGRLDIGR